MSWLVCVRKKRSQKQIGCAYIKSSDMYHKVQPFTLRADTVRLVSILRVGVMSVSSRASRACQGKGGETHDDNEWILGPMIVDHSRSICDLCPVSASASSFPILLLEQPLFSSTKRGVWLRETSSRWRWCPKRSKARTALMRFEPLNCAVNDEDANVDVLRVDRYVRFALCINGALL